jgi:Arc/MetJ family transcription regulator
MRTRLEIEDGLLAAAEEALPRARTRRELVEEALRRLVETEAARRLVAETAGAYRAAVDVRRRRRSSS